MLNEPIIIIMKQRLKKEVPKRSSMYSLRSVKAASKSRDAQTTIDFRRRKRTSSSMKIGPLQPSESSEDTLAVNKCSPPKRTKCLQEPGTIDTHSII